MQRRRNVDLLATEIDTLDRIVRARDGTLFVYLPPTWHWYEIQVENERIDYRTRAKERLLRGRPFVCAIFHWIPAGMYTVRCKSGKRVESVVTVQAGVLTQLDWRQADAENDKNAPQGSS
ncbi:MAG: hypothetical protein AB7R89_28665 [Dehalococcoidia bacterium]